VSKNEATVPAPAEPVARWAELSEQIARCARRLRAEVGQRASASGLSEAQFSLLWACTQGPAEGLNQNEIAAASAVSAAHVSNLVEQLRARGLLEGQRRAPDRRRQVWQITAAGRRELHSLLTHLATWADPLDAQLGPEQREALLGLLQQLARLIQTPGGESMVTYPSDCRGAA
jgi:DNA-binding MarR family transcriptional regulator